MRVHKGTVGLICLRIRAASQSGNESIQKGPSGIKIQVVPHLFTMVPPSPPMVFQPVPNIALLEKRERCTCKNKTKKHLSIQSGFVFRDRSTKIILFNLGYS